jgi:DNA polymerase III sliding clamp (beta) subunit (PCNA family)
MLWLILKVKVLLFLSAKLISEIVRSLEAGTISMDIKENGAVLTSGRSSFNFEL